MSNTWAMVGSAPVSLGSNDNVILLGGCSMNETPRARRIAYSVAVLAPAVSLLLRWPLWPVLENAFPHMTFFPAVMIAAYLGGFWPGLLATGLSAFAADYFLPRQASSF